MGSRRVRICLATVAGLLSCVVTAAAPLSSAGQPSSAALTPSLHLIGSAHWVNGTIRLTTFADPHAVGAAWTATQLPVTHGFDVSFGLRITPTHPIQDPTWLGYGDGAAFVLQNDPRGVNAAGGDGDSLGFGQPDGIANSVAVEFDTANNGPSQLPGGPDPNANHISVLTRGTAPNSANEQYSLGSTTQIPNLSDGNLHAVQIRYRPGQLAIFLDNMSSPVLTVPYTVTSSLDLLSGNAWLGVTAETGDGTETHDITAFAYAPPQPTDKGQCRHGGWRNYVNSGGSKFRNQGQCISFVNHVNHRKPSRARHEAADS